MLFEGKRIDLLKVCSVFIVLLSGAVIAYSPSLILVLLGVTSLLAVAIVVPREALLLAGLLALVLVPVGYVGFPQVFGRYFTPSVFLLFVWSIRTLTNDSAGQKARRARVPKLILLALTLVLIAETVFRGNYYSWLWTGTVLTSLITPIHASLRQESHKLFSPTVFSVLGVVIGLAALLEFLFGINPWNFLYTADVEARSWSVFRAKTSLGHPLTTMTVSIVILIVALFGATSASTRNRWIFILGAIGAALAAVLTASRAGAFAASVGILVGVLGVVFNRRRQALNVSRVLYVAAAGSIALVSVVYSPLLQRRSSTSDAATSDQYRSNVEERALNLFHDRPVFGWGPGSSNILFEQIYRSTLENSALQVLVSGGVVLAAAFGLLVVWAIINAIANGHPGLAGAMASIPVAMSGYNALESNAALMALFTYLVIASSTESGRSDAERDAEVSGSVRVTKSASRNYMPTS